MTHHDEHAVAASHGGAHRTTKAAAETDDAPNTKRAPATTAMLDTGAMPATAAITSLCSGGSSGST
ncbi:hypothetical protein MARA_62090 [Mycolicibacterium arabiense]|uniref:Uncharacterized protein n=1 Tax=Mycolicibacterium arabiense TaxID=1286181 RepID=A0A7I7S8L8_9MYCO|nr:hypothetical protein MARA_62090 [Mycolicibacterium arabiense]